jgi:hypothetical protein
MLNAPAILAQHIRPIINLRKKERIVIFLDDTGSKTDWAETQLAPLVIDDFLELQKLVVWNQGNIGCVAIRTDLSFLGIQPTKP